MSKGNGLNIRLRNRLLTVSEVAQILNVHPNTVRQWSDSGLLKVCRFGYRHDRKFKPEEILKFLNNNQS